MAKVDTAVVRPLAVVTGASSGIGYELARQFAQNGFDLLVTAEDAGIEKVARTVQGFEALMAGTDKVVAGSVKNKAMVAAVSVLPQTTTAQLHRGLSEPGSGRR